MQKMGLLELNAVVAVSTHRSFRRAADELGMSPSAMSHAIAALEQRMGVRLFNRTTRSVSLSEAGEQFLARVQPALHEISVAMEAVNQFRDTPSGTLRINATEAAVQMIMTPVVVEFLKRYPDMRLDIVTDTALVDIVADGFDAGIRLADSVPLDMIAVPCSPPLQFAVVGSPEYFARHGKPRSPADLAKHSCIRTRFASGALYRWEFEKRGHQQIIDVNGPLTLDSHQLIVDAALQGVGLACTSEHSIAGHLAAGRLIRVLQDWLPPYPGLCLYYPANRHVPAGLRAFIDLVREVYGRKTAE
ncbi:LysR family transcriptional regulator [Pseudomonas sp. dw_612]|uniref:LysR family transcriptional regulator n=1 Tax=Pseudomonas sp. dw_612 TaxID=2720080 RepID=UPI001BD56C2A|nr:LysR family transcriptional regulator [Pseudomonas sp. dw_612]